MALKERKITTYEDNIKKLSDYPSEDGISSAQLKAMFDGRGDKELKSAINGIIEELMAQTGAEQIGSIAGNVQRELDLKVDKENGEVIGDLEVSTVSGEGSVEIKPAIYGQQAEIKLSDINGLCASLGMDYDGNLTISYGNEYIQEKENSGAVYTELSHPKLDLLNAQLSDGEMRRVRKNIGISEVDNTSDENKPISKATMLALKDKADVEDPVLTGVINLDRAEIYNTGNKIVIYRPMVDIAPESTLEIGPDLAFNGNTIYHEGNLINLASIGVVITEEDRKVMRDNLGVTAILGDIDSALEGIIAIQSAYTGGEA